MVRLKGTLITRGIVSPGDVSKLENGGEFSDEHWPFLALPNYQNISFLLG